MFKLNRLLSKILEKRGIKSVNELTPEEYGTFEQWQAILSKDTLTTEDIKEFCQNNIDVIESKWRDLNIDQSKKAELIPYHTVYKTLLAAIDSPNAERMALENQLNQLIES